MAEVGVKRSQSLCVDSLKGWMEKLMESMKKAKKIHLFVVSTDICRHLTRLLMFLNILTINYVNKQIIKLK